LLGYQMYRVMLVSLVFVIGAYAADSQVSTSRTDHMPQHGTSQQMAKAEKTIHYDEAQLKSDELAVQHGKEQTSEARKAMWKADADVQKDSTEVQSLESALQQERRQEDSIDDEWYKALQNSKQQLRQSKQKYDSYYFYSNFCAAVVIFVIVASGINQRLRVVPNNWERQNPRSAWLLPPPPRDSYLRTDAEYQRLPDGNVEAKYDDIQKRWDQKVLGPDRQHVQNTYEEIQKRWDAKVLGPDKQHVEKTYEDIQKRWDEKVLGA